MELKTTIKAEHRTVTGKKVRQLRLEGWVPGIAYGPDMDSLPIQFARKELVAAYREVGTSALLGLLLARQKEPQPAIIREVQRDSLSLEILHVDLEMVDMNRPITTHVPITLVGKSIVVEQGLSVLTHGLDEIEVRALPANIPAHVEVNLSALVQVDQALRVSDLVLPADIAILTDPATVIVFATSIRRLEEAEARAEARAAEAAAAAAEVPAAEGKPAAEKKEEEKES
jgi:large subunit ribosomal protein L25